MLGVNTPALPASLRRRNQRTLISLLLRLGSASRADLAKAARLSQPTAGKITAELLKLGLIKEVQEKDQNENRSPRLGRPGQLLSLEDRRSRFIAVEIGVKETRLAALPVAAQLQESWQQRFKTQGSPEKWLQELRDRSREVIVQKPWGVLVSVPGVIDEALGRVLFSPNLHWLEHTDLVSQIRRVWDVPVLLIQEIRALALGHLTAAGTEDFFLVDFGQGVGGAIVANGQLSANAVPLSGEVGHTPVSDNMRPCGCGAIGCLETLVSHAGLLRSFHASGHAGGRAADLNSLVQHVERHGLEPWLADSLSAAARTIAGALNVLGIHHVVVTGLIAKLPQAAIEFLFEGIRSGAMWARFGEIVCEVAPRRRAAGLVAAGLDRLVLPEEGPARANRVPQPAREARPKLRRRGRRAKPHLKTLTRNS